MYRRVADMSRRLVRIECRIQEFNTSRANSMSAPPPERTPSKSLLEYTTTVLQTFYPSILLFLTTSSKQTNKQSLINHQLFS